MSMIQTIQPNHFGDRKNRNVNRQVIPPMTRKSYTNLSFGNTVIPKIEKSISDSQIVAIDEIITKKYLGKTGAFLNVISKTAGEIQNIIFIGLGTAFVAPIFIAYNPVAKEDEKTKKYSALRQPISAVISTATGLGINYPIAKVFDKWAAEGKIQKFDMSAKPSSDFLAVRYAKIKKNFNNLKELDKKYLNLVDSQGNIKSVDEFIKKFADAKAFEKVVHTKTLDLAADKLLDLNNKDGIKNKTVREFIIEHLGFEEDFKDKSVLNPDLTKEKLKNTTAMTFLKVFGFDEKEFSESSIRALIANHLYKDEVSFNKNERKFIVKTTELMTTEEMKNKEKITLKNLLKVFDCDDDFHKNHKILNMKVSDFIEIVHDKFGDLDSSNDAKKIKNTELKQFARNIAINAVKKSESAFKAYSKVQGIILSLAVLPFACGALNWSYPRIMEKYFPKLSASKTDNKGGK